MKQKTTQSLESSEFYYNKNYVCDIQNKFLTTSYCMTELNFWLWLVLDVFVFHLWNLIHWNILSELMSDCT